MEADRIAQRMSEEDANWFRQNSIDIARRDYNSTMEHYQQMGLEKGLEKGLKQGMQQGLEKGLQQGMQQGMQQGAQQKAVEAALVAIKDFGAPPEAAAEKMGAPLDLVLEALKAAQAAAAN